MINTEQKNKNPKKFPEQLQWALS